MRSVGLYSTARYGLYFEQYIDGYIINCNMLHFILQMHFSKNVSWSKTVVLISVILSQSLETNTKHNAILDYNWKGII